MSAAPMPAEVGDLPEAFTGLEVATASADALRAGITVAGVLDLGGAALLASVLRSHLAAGRRYLRVDLAAAQFADPGVADELVRAHDSVTELGGMLVFENAGRQILDAMEHGTLFVRGPV